MKQKDQEARDWAYMNGGVVTREVLDSLGFTRHEIDGRVRRHGWVGIARGRGYQLVPPRDHLDAVLGAIAVLPNAVASHETAAELHRVPFVPLGRAVVSVHSRTTYRYPGVEVHRTHDIADEQITEVRGLRCTTLARTVIDLACVRSGGHIGRIVDDLVAQERLVLDELVSVVSVVGRRGKPGTSVMREVLDSRIGGARSQSELERRGRALIAQAGLPEPIHEFPIPWVPHRRFDDAFPGLRLAIEWDSRRYHGQLDAFDMDRSRDREAVINGWRVLRFTWTDVVERPSMVIDTIRSVVA